MLFMNISTATEYVAIQRPVGVLRSRLEHKQTMKPFAKPPGIDAAVWPLAVHEAGHIIVGVAVGGEALSARVSATDGACDVRFPVAVSTRERVAYGLAGGLAESAMIGSRSLAACISDKDSNYIAAELRGCADIEAIRDSALALARRTIRNNRKQVFSLAQALARQKHVTRSSLAALLKQPHR